MRPHHRLLIDYIHKLQNQLQMIEWRIYLELEPPEGPDAVASVHIFDNGSAEAWIRVAERFWDQSPDQQREAIVHELLHVMTHDLLISGRILGETDYIPLEVQDMANRALQRAEERVVDRLARVIAEDFALPPHEDPRWRSGQLYAPTQD